MLSPRAEIEPVLGDYELALATLVASLDHIAATKPEPTLRVMFLNSAIVSLISISEEALRSLFQRYLYCLRELVDSHDKLRKELQRRNARQGVELLRKLDIPTDIRRALDILEKLDGCLSGTPNYELFREALTFNHGNFRSSQITDIAKSCGISEFLKTACDCTVFAEYFGEDDIERRLTIFTTKWNEVFDERDTIIHRISQASGWADQRIRQAIDLFLVVMRRISECLVVDADSFAKS